MLFCKDSSTGTSKIHELYRKKTYMNPVYQLYIERNYFCGAK